MDHSLSLLGGRGAGEQQWKAFLERLRNNATETSNSMARVRARRDFAVQRKNQPTWKHYQGDFRDRLEGIRSVEALADDLLVCFPHLDITEDVELQTGRKLTQVYTSYPEREARSANPRKYDKPFYIRLFQSKGAGEVLILTPSALPAATDYVLDNEILSRFQPRLSAIPFRFPADPFAFLDPLFELNRLDRIQSVRVSVTRREGEPPAEIAQPFPSNAASLANFRTWYGRQTRDNHSVSTISVGCSVLLEDLEGKTFDVVLRPQSRAPVGVSVSQKSSARSSAYRLITDVLRRILARP